MRSSWQVCTWWGKVLFYWIFVHAERSVSHYSPARAKQGCGFRAYTTQLSECNIHTIHFTSQVDSCHSAIHIQYTSLFCGTKSRNLTSLIWDAIFRSCTSDGWHWLIITLTGWKPTQLTSWETLHPCMDDAPYLDKSVSRSSLTLSRTGLDKYAPILNNLIVRANHRRCQFCTCDCEPGSLQAYFAGFGEQLTR